MAHEIDTTTGRAAIAFTGDVPWHGLGQQLQPGADIDTWARAAGMNYQVLRSIPRFATERDQDPRTLSRFPGRHILFRDDTKAPLSIVSPTYQIVQPREVLEFFRNLVAEAGFELCTAGVLFDGTRYWALAKVGETATIVDKDQVGSYLLLSTSCDGSLATTAFFTTIRVVCNNTLSAALSAGSKTVIKVSHRSVFDAARVQDQLGIGRGQFAKFITAARDLAARPIERSAAERFVANLLAEKSTRKSGIERTSPFKRILALFDGEGLGATLEGSQGTRWGLLNAVTQHVDHEARAQTDDQRIANAFWGDGDILKTRAFELLQAA